MNDERRNKKHIHTHTHKTNKQTKKDGSILNGYMDTWVDIYGSIDGWVDRKSKNDNENQGNERIKQTNIFTVKTK